jgi:ribosome-interacting GTPase 1
MPTNLPPEYFEVDKRYREAQAPEEKVALLEELISTVPKHKGTDKLRADLRRQLSKLKEEAQAHAGKKHGGHASIFVIEREGAGQAALVGATNVGKSALLRALTNAEPEVSPAPYTTWRPMPGMMPIEDIQVQLVDTPPMDRDYVEPGLFDLIRRTDVILLVVDLQADPLEQLELTLDLLQAHRIAPAHLKARFLPEQRMVLIPTILLANKCDDESMDELFEVCCEILEGEWPILPVSALTGRNFDRLKRLVYERLEIIRVYARPPGKEPDLERPFVLKKGSTVAELARKVHRDFYENLKSARVWGSSAFEGQMVQRDYRLQDGDIVELRV